MRVMDKIAVITGSTSGIGESIARLFFRNGAKVVVTGRDEARGLALRDELVAKTTRSGRPADDPRCIFIPCDVSNRSMVATLRDQTVDAFGSIDILVNNAGIQAPSAFEKLSEKSWDRVMDIDLKGCLHCLQLVGEHMIKQRSGVILNIASISAHYAYPDGGAYGPAKAAVLMMTKQCAMEWAPYNIRVNSISPGLIRTPLSENIYQHQEITEARCQQIPLGRIGRPQDVAQAAMFLCSSESAYITAQDLVVDGGLTDCVFQGIPGRATLKEPL